MHHKMQMMRWNRNVNEVIEGLFKGLAGKMLE
ncbi:hypothetical protein Nwat_0975 [Nitrosococcus watsonii C-113]|uniref:Uncharacterized protein n=1 Tax=Nitrosococcus watsoni (strain C-113) TaxID=105559 RepID=D8K4U1_NITWC|nr:hypothetical protein Nwat_0975 [Nitrosococcus watsonii C-113]